MLLAVGCFSISAASVWQSPRSRENASRPSRKSGVFRVYVGTYTGGSGDEKSRGIYVLDLDSKSGKLSTPRLACEAIDPSFLAIHPSGKFLYAVSERGEVDGQPGGAVLGFSIDPATGELARDQPAIFAGCGPLSPGRGQGREKCARWRTYGSGSVASLPIDAGGRLGESIVVHSAQGQGSDPAGQEGPHAHSINLDRAGRFAVAADLGLDKVFVYRFDGARDARRQRSAVCQGRAQVRPAALRVSSGRPVRLCDRRDGQHRDGVRVRRVDTAR